MTHLIDTSHPTSPQISPLPAGFLRPSVLRSAGQRAAAALAMTLTVTAGAAAPAEAQLYGQAEPAVEAAVEDIILDYMAEKGIPGMTVAASKDGKMIMEKSYGLRDLDNQLPMYYWNRTRMGSLSKMLTAMTFMKYVEDTQDPGLLDRELYGFNGIFSVQDYPEYYSARDWGWHRQTPVVGTVISKFDDRVYTYYDNGQFSVGTTSDLDAYEPPTDFNLPGNQDPRDIQAMATATTGHVFTWYRDGRASIGTFDDLDATFYTSAEVDLPDGQTMEALVGVGISGTTDKVYAWWDDGTRTVGNYADLDFYSNRASYETALGQNTYTIRSLAISKSDRVYAFYNDETVSKGTSTNLDTQQNAYGTDLPPQIQAEPWGTWFSNITPRHLLNHSAGYEKNIGLSGASAMATGQPAAQAFDSELGMELFHEYGLVSGRMLFAPGADNHYSNHGGALSGFVLEEVSGIPFKALLDTTVLNPMNVWMGVAWDPIGGDSEPHFDRNKNNGSPPDVFTCECLLGFNFREQSGYLTSTAGDFLRVMMTMDLASAPSRRVLSDANIALMETPGFGADYGLGWKIVDPNGWLDHGGSLKGGGAAVSRFKAGYVKDRVVMDDVTVVVMGNLDTPVRELSEKLAWEISQIFVNPFYDIF
ncbi:MAG: serine hydrolase domain-containing protein [Acidobacteriota bacterium]